MRGKWWGIVLMGILAVHLLGWNTSLAQSARVLQEWEAFKAKYGQDFRVRWDEVRGTPSPIYGQPIPLGADAVRDERSVEKATMAFLTEHQVLLGVNPQDLKLISARRVQDPTRWFVVYGQYYNGVRVDGGKAGMVLDGEGNIVGLGSGFYPDVQVSTVSALSESEALDIVRNVFGSAPSSPAFTTMLIMPSVDSEGITYRLVWFIVLQRELQESLCIVDAHDGQILRKMDNIAPTTVQYVRGTVWPLYGRDINGNPVDPEVQGMGGIYVPFTGVPDPRITTFDGMYNDYGVPPGAQVDNAVLDGVRAEVTSSVTGWPNVSHSGARSWTWGDAEAVINQVNVYYHHHASRARGTRNMEKP